MLNLAMVMMNVVEGGPSVAATLLTAATRITLRTALSAAVSTPTLTRWPWPYGAIDWLASFLPKGSLRSPVRLTHSTADLIYAPGVPYTGRVILYFHGGGFLTCGTHTHLPLIVRLSRAAQAPVLSVNYRMLPHSLRDGISDCLEGYLWLRQRYDANQIALAGDSAGGYMAMATAIHLAGIETPGAMVLMSPLLELATQGKKDHVNAATDAMFNGGAFDALYGLLNRANDGVLFEPLDQLHTVMEGYELPPTLIHASGSEVLLHDAIRAEETMTELGASVELTIWPGQIHVFQLAAPFVPEAQRSIDQLGRFVNEKTSKKVSGKPDLRPTVAVG